MQRMFVPQLTRKLAKLQVADRPAANQILTSPCIAAIYGFASREHMQRHLLKFLRQSGYNNTTMYGHLQVALIADDLQQAAAQGHAIVLIGFSQGGLEAVHVAKELERRGVSVDLLVTIAAGGKGRLLPHRKADDPRTIPSNVACCLNYFSASDFLGTDAKHDDNLAVATTDTQHVENIFFTKQQGISHLAISRAYPAAKIPECINEQLLQRLLKELAALKSK